LGEEIYQDLRTAILKGELAPGERLVEARLAQDFGASRTPIRQALHMLAREQLVGRLPRGGFFVLGLSAADVDQIMDLRAVLEAFAAGRAAREAGVAQRSLLTERNEAFGRAIGRESAEELARLSAAFHQALYQLAGNRWLSRTIDELDDHLQRYRQTLFSSPDQARVSYQDHRAMIQAMAKGDPALVEALVRDHMDRGRDAMKRAIELKKSSLDEK
jgi:DNA-binding GntR family transcriptional regulator